MLISCIAHLKARGQEWRNVHVYGQEINALTSAIGRMNLFLHGVEDFHIVNDDTLKNPAFIKNGQLMQFDLVLANPPYSIKQWDRAAFETDKYERNAFGTPPQARADYAFIQHIIASLKPDTGRAAILLPHGVLNRNEEKEIRKAIVQSDCIDAVIGLGRHLFYNSGLESCILLLRMNKPAVHRGTVLFIEAEKCTHKVQAQNYLFDEDIQKIVSAYLSDEDVPNFSRRVSMDEILANEGNLNIKMYVNSDIRDEDDDCGEQLEAFFEASSASHAAYNELVDGNPDESGAFDHATVSFANIDKSQWKRVKLSDVAEEYAERIDDPSESDYEWYIGSDCIGGYDFRITKRQPASKIHSAQKLFKKGDYLLVRRSLYGSDFRERAPRADFDGICSADILTIREKPGMVADGFLIAVLYSSRLWDFIVRESTGSLTRRIKWNQLKDFEFDLPPYDQQQKIASMLWGMDAAQSAYKHLIEMSDEYVKSQFVEMFKGGRYPIVKAQDICEFITKGTTPPSNEIFSEPPDEPIPYLKVYNLSFDGSLLFQEEPQYIQRDIHEGKLARSKVYPNDVLMNIVGPPLGKFSLVTDEYPEWNINQAIAIFRAKKQIIPVFLLYALMQPDVLKPFLDSAQGVRSRAEIIHTECEGRIRQCKAEEGGVPGHVDRRQRRNGGFRQA